MFDPVAGNTGNLQVLLWRLILGDRQYSEFYQDLNAEEKPNRVQRLNRAGTEFWNSSSEGNSLLSGNSRGPRQGTLNLGPRVQACHLVH